MEAKLRALGLFILTTQGAIRRCRRCLFRGSPSAAAAAEQELR